MRRISFLGDFWDRFSRCRLARPLPAVLLLLANAATTQAAEKIAVFPETAFDGFIIHESLVIFWIAILGLLVIIRMKLREIERIQEMGADQEDKDAPLLE